MLKKSLLAIGSAVLLVMLAACGNGGSQDSANDGKTKIYTTIYPIQYFAERIGGDNVEVESVLPPGSDAHSFEPTSNQLVDIAKADAFLYSSDEMETYAATIADAVKEEDVKIAQMADGIDLIEFSEAHEHSHEGEAAEEAHNHNHEGEAAEEEHDHSHEGEAAGEEHDHSHEGEAAEEEHHHSHEGEAAEEEHHHSHEGEAAEEEHDHSHEGEAAEEEHDHSHEGEAAEEEHHHHHGSTDPHYWLDPLRAKQMAENVKNQLVELDPDNKSAYEENYDALAKDLDELDQKFQQAVEGKENKKIIVSHAAYGYWEDRYGVEQIAIAGLSPTNEPSQQKLQNIVHLAEDNHLNYVLFEQNVSPKVATVVQEEIDADVLRVHNLATRTEEEVKNDDDYFTIMNRNIETIEKALANKK